MQKINLWLQKLNPIITLIGGAAVVLMMVQVSLDVFFRFVLNTPLPGTITIVAHYYMIIAIFLPLAYVEQTKKSISIELISGYFPPALNRFLTTFNHLFIAVTSYLIAYASFSVAIKNFHSKSSVMQGDYTIPTWPSYFILFLGVFLLGTYCFINFLTSLTGSSIQAEHDNE